MSDFLKRPFFVYMSGNLINVCNLGMVHRAERIIIITRVARLTRFFCFIVNKLSGLSHKVLNDLEVRRHV